MLTLVVIHSFPGSLVATPGLPHNYPITPVEVELPVVLLPVDTSVHMPLYCHDIQHFAGPIWKEQRNHYTRVLDHEKYLYLSLV